MPENPKTPKRPRDMSQLAKHIVDITTGEGADEDESPSIYEERAAKGGKARASRLTPEERSEIARKAHKPGGRTKSRRITCGPTP